VDLFNSCIDSFFYWYDTHTAQEPEAGCKTCDGLFYCVTITWQQIFEVSV